MKICGLQKLTLLDFPTKIACTVFTGGCNLRCPFCHNASLVTGVAEAIDAEEFFAFLAKRKGLLQGVCISGGEPLLQKDIVSFINRIRDMGYAVKLDTNGTNPRMLRSVVDEGLVDYVAMDIKNSPSRYAETCGGIDVLQQVQESAALLMTCGVDYEFRTTLAHPLHTVEDMELIGRWLQGARRYFLQQFIDSGDLIGTGLQPLSAEEMEQMRQAVLPYIKETTIRGR